MTDEANTTVSRRDGRRLHSPRDQLPESESMSDFFPAFRLCLEETDDGSTLQDTMTVDFGSRRATLVLHEILSTISGVDFLNEPLLPSALCSSCTTTAVNSLIFKNLCQESASHWSNALDSLQNLFHFSHSTDKTKALYIIVDKHSTRLIEDHKERSKRKKVCKRARFLVLKKRQICEYCSACFGKKAALDEHLRKFHADKDPFRCQYCGRVCKSRQFLLRHYRIHPDVEPRFGCTQCSMIFTDQWHMKRHAEAVHGEKSVKCTDCPKFFASEGLLKVHKGKVHCGYRFECAHCAKTFKTKSKVKEHEDSHIDKVCEKCGKIYSAKTNYLRHLQKCRDGGELFVDVKFKRRSRNNKIMKDLNERYMCDLCGKIFIQKRGLAHHIDTLHLNQKAHQCPTCGKKFNTRGQARVHQVVHTRERPERCGICSKYFVTKAALLYHTRLHTGEKPYACDICGEGFVNASRRMAHKRMRHWERAHGCQLCGQKFYTGYCLRTHMARHYNPSSKLFSSRQHGNVILSN